MNIEHNIKTIKYLKHYIKLLIGRPDPMWALFVFEGKAGWVKSNLTNHPIYI